MHAALFAVTLPADFDMPGLRHMVAQAAPPTGPRSSYQLHAHLVRERTAGSLVNRYAAFYLGISATDRLMWEEDIFQRAGSMLGRRTVHRWVDAAFTPGPASEVPPQCATIALDRLPGGVDSRQEISSGRSRLVRQSQWGRVHSMAVMVDPPGRSAARITFWGGAPTLEPGALVYRALRVATSPG